MTDCNMKMEGQMGILIQNLLDFVSYHIKNYFEENFPEQKKPYFDRVDDTFVFFFFRKIYP